MAVYIEGQGREIRKGTYGKDIRGPISDALWILYNHGLRATTKKLVTQEEYDALEVKEQNVAYCIYDPTEPVWKDYWISVIMLDGDADTDDVFYCKTLAEARAKLDEYYENDPNIMYRIWIGEECGVTEVPNRTFQTCKNILAFHVPGTITAIREYAFTGSTLRYVTYTESDIGLFIERSAFHNTKLSEVVIPNRYIHSSTRGHEYSWNEYLTNVTFGESMTRVTYNMFEYDRLLDDVVFTDSITDVESNAFYRCEGLTTVDLNNAYYLNNNAFAYCMALKDIDLSNVTHIGNETFRDCYSLERIELASISYLGIGSFMMCSNLKTVVFHPGNQISIPEACFDNCYALTTVVLQDEPAFKDIGARAFAECTSLPYISIPNSVQTIGTKAFESCESMTAISLSDNLITIKDHAFWGCTLLDNLVLPESLTSIEAFAFYNCQSLTSLAFPPHLTDISNYVCGHCIALESVSIPSSVASIGAAAFESCRSLKTISIPNGPTYIGGGAFNGCSSLESVTIGNAVEQIFDDPSNPRVFAGCRALKRININRTEGSIVDSNGNPWTPKAYTAYLPEDCEIRWLGGN